MPVPSYSWPRRTQVADKIVSPSCFRSSLSILVVSTLSLLVISVVVESCNLSRPSTIIVFNNVSLIQSINLFYCRFFFFFRVKLHKYKSSERENKYNTFLHCCHNEDANWHSVQCRITLRDYAALFHFMLKL